MQNVIPKNWTNTLNSDKLPFLSSIFEPDAGDDAAAFNGESSVSGPAPEPPARAENIQQTHRLKRVRTTEE